MSSYILAMVVTDCESIERIYKTYNRTVRMRLLGRQEQLPYLNETIAAVPGMLRHLETYLDQQLAIPKIDFIAYSCSLPWKTGVSFYSRNVNF